MTLDPKNRSPHQTFGRSSWEPDPGDADLLPKPTVYRPSVVDPELLASPDLGVLPWTRRRGDEWTDATFRALVLGWLRGFFRDRRDQGLAGWDITEKASAERSVNRLPPAQQYLRVGITKRVREEDHRVEVAIPFPPEDRADPSARLAHLAASIDAQLATIK